MASCSFWLKHSGSGKHPKYFSCGRQLGYNSDTFIFSKYNLFATDCGARSPSFFHTQAFSLTCRHTHPAGARFSSCRASDLMSCQIHTRPEVYRIHPLSDQSAASHLHRRCESRARSGGRPAGRWTTSMRTGRLGNAPLRNTGAGGPIKSDQRVQTAPWLIWMRR